MDGCCGPHGCSVGCMTGIQGPFLGVFKSFNEEKGWGHITSEATYKLFGKDVFVIRSALRGVVAPGHQVQFCVSMGAKGPQAREVRSLEGGGSDISPQMMAGKVFTGQLKLFNEEKGWGFITCEETRNLFCKDVFVHKREFGNTSPTNGEEFQFTVETGNDGRPEARNVIPVGGFAPVKSMTVTERAAPY